jgi:hypothetical protein
MTRLECLGCGHVLELPPSIGEGGWFACASCGLVMRNVAAARSFRWRDVDPYVRRHGASRTNLWGGLTGAVLWLPILAGVLAAQGRFDGAFLVALALPYLALLAVLARTRSRTSAASLLYRLWAGLGGYAVYVGALLLLEPRWRPLLSGTSGVEIAPRGLLGFGAIALVVGGAGGAVHRARMRSVPRISGTPQVNE